MSERVRDELLEAWETARGLLCVAIAYGWPILVVWLLEPGALK